jgi:hypothetical protein
MGVTVITLAHFAQSSNLSIICLGWSRAPSSTYKVICIFILNFPHRPISVTPISSIFAFDLVENLMNHKEDMALTTIGATTQTIWLASELSILETGRQSNKLMMNLIF